MNYIPLASAPLPVCVYCGQDGILLPIRSSCGCTLPLHPNCQGILQMWRQCPLCRVNWTNSSASSVATSRTEIIYQPNRTWVLYCLGCFVLILATCIITWFLYKAF